MTKQETPLTPQKRTRLCLGARAGDATHLETSDGLVTVHVVEVRGNRVRLRYEAPPSVRIERDAVRRNSAA